MAKYPNWGVSTDVSAANLALGIPNIVTKASANTITSNTTLANDSELTNLALGIGTWKIEVMLWATGVAAAAGNLKTAWSFATGTLTGTPNRTTIGPAASGTTVANVQTPVNISATAYSTSNIYFLSSTTVFATITEMCPNFVVATAGTLSIQVAQGTSSATSTVVQPGSRVEYRQIA